ncbi:glycosyltransferase [Pedobacter sp. Leaf194]|uniref:glycosyltransferase n=1 Tax=Pedobacter sp. Leaf194 TaxID=1736297 RepID=UPI0007028BF7|nr:glycosyltransferase [Pedobacter sp. Leaf194]KQS36274.1 hypothetical protein ASG14_12685 [Pedobacter sp. Leaf194]
MKIAVIAKTRLPIAEPFRGGLEAFTHSLCEEYLKLGHQINLFAHSDSDPELNVKGFYGNEHREDRYYDIYEHDEYLSILKTIEQSDFDIVHNNSTHELPVLWAKSATIPVVTTIHTPPISKLKAAVKICSDGANMHFILPSKSFQSIWLPYTGDNSSVIHNGVDLLKWPLARISRDYLFWFGRIVHDKGLDIVMDAARELEIPLKFAGPQDDKKYFHEQINPRIGEHATYLGHLDQAGLQKNMKGAAAVVSGVRWEEPFGLTNIEAMSSGVPIAGFNRGAFSELINADSGTVAKQNTVHSLALAIKDAIPLESKKVRHRAETFSLNKMALGYIKYFEELL